MRSTLQREVVMRLFCVWLLATALSISWGGLSRLHAADGDQLNTIKGIVQSQDLRRINQAIVQVRDQEGTIVTQVVTNQAGEFTVTVPQEGTYSVRALLDTYKSEFVVVKIGVAWLAYDVGSEALAHRDYDRAAIEYRHAIALDPGKTLYHSALAATHFQSFEGTGDRSRALAAVSELKEATALNPLDGRLCGLLAQVHAALSFGASRSQDPAVVEQRGSWLRTALDAYECAIRLEPFNPFYRLEIARVYLALGESGRAQASVEEAVKLEPNFLAAREWLARRHLQAARLDAARDEYREVVERQQRYAVWNKTPYEAQLLRADVAGLAAELEAKKPKT